MSSRGKRSEPGATEVVREVCAALPGVTERLSHGGLGFFVGRQFVQLWPNGHHDNRFLHMWCAAPEGAQSDLVSARPASFFRPPYVGGRGWVGVRLDGEMGRGEIETLCEDAYRSIASSRWLKELDRPI